MKPGLLQYLEGFRTSLLLCGEKNEFGNLRPFTTANEQTDAMRKQVDESRATEKRDVIVKGDRYNNNIQ